MPTKTLQCSNLSFRYPDSAVSVFDNLNASFHSGWTAIIGANGVGKTTLVKILCHHIVPDSGWITQDLKIQYVEQSVSLKPQTFRSFLESYEPQAFKIKEMLHIKDDWGECWNVLSSGEKKRIQLACALCQNPDVLILDEPTNHLDSLNKKQVVQALQSFRGIGLVITHDRFLLNSLLHGTLLFETHRVTQYACSWEDARALVQTEQANLLHKKEVLQNKISQLDIEVHKRKAQTQKAKSRLSKKHIPRKDHDRKARIDGARLTGKDRSDARAQRQLDSRKKHLEGQKSSLFIEKKYGIGVVFEELPSYGPDLIHLENQIFSISSSFRIHIPKLHIAWGEKVAVVGANACGKTSLLKNIASQSGQENVAYIPQEISYDFCVNHLHRIHQMNSEQKGKIFTLIRRLGSNPCFLQNSNSPSPGEMRKLLIAESIVDGKNTLILDEPTNHLDLIAIQALEEMLKLFQGSLLLVSHDEVLVQNLAKRVYEMKREKENSFLKESFL